MINEKPNLEIKPIKYTRLLSGISYYKIKDNVLLTYHIIFLLGYVISRETKKHFLKFYYFIGKILNYFLTFLLYLVVMPFIIASNIIGHFKEFYNIVNNQKFL